MSRTGRGAQAVRTACALEQERRVRFAHRFLQPSPRSSCASRNEHAPLSQGGLAEREGSCEARFPEGGGFNLQAALALLASFFIRPIAQAALGSRSNEEAALSGRLSTWRRERDCARRAFPEGEASTCKPRSLCSPASSFDRSLKLRLAPGRTKKPPFRGGFQLGGERGIRTPDTLFRYTHFPGARLKPLGHLSGWAPKIGSRLRCPCSARSQGSAILARRR